MNIVFTTFDVATGTAFGCYLACFSPSTLYRLKWSSTTDGIALRLIESSNFFTTEVPIQKRGLESVPELNGKVIMWILVGPVMAISLEHLLFVVKNRDA